tara:strand:+ start:322 stop:1653 length:1332 start_codon:yes stop_codon:yes gene_type:complete
MKNVHSDRWKGKKLREIYASKLKDIPDGYIFKLYQILYKSNQKNGNNYSTVGFISFTGDKYKIGYCDNFSRKDLELATHSMKEFKFDKVEEYCYIFYIINNGELSLYRQEYPWLNLKPSELPINCLFKNYNPEETYKKIKDKSFDLEIFIYGRLREIILHQSMSPDSISIINTKFPDGKYNKENIIVGNIYDRNEFEDFTGISIPLFEERLDICIILEFKISKTDSLMMIPIVIPKYKCLKDTKNRRNMFEKFRLTEYNKYCVLQSLYNRSQRIGDLFIPHDTFYVEKEFSDLYYDKGSIIQSLKFSDKIISKIKQKQQGYANFDKKRFRSVSSLTVDEICKLLWIYNYKCDECGINVCINYTNNCPNQFSIDRINDNEPHKWDNCRLTCLDCNRLHKQNELFTANGLEKGNMIYVGKVEYKNNECSCCKQKNDFVQKALYDT